MSVVSKMKNQKSCGNRCPLEIMSNICSLLSPEEIAKHYAVIERWINDTTYKAPEILIVSWRELQTLLMKISVGMDGEKINAIGAIFSGSATSGK